MDYQIATHHVEPQAIVSIRDRRKQADLPGFLKTAFPELFGRLRLLGVPWAEQAITQPST